VPPRAGGPPASRFVVTCPVRTRVSHDRRAARQRARQDDCPTTAVAFVIRAAPSPNSGLPHHTERSPRTSPDAAVAVDSKIRPGQRLNPSLSAIPVGFPLTMAARGGRNAREGSGGTGRRALRACATHEGSSPLPIIRVGNDRRAHDRRSLRFGRPPEGDAESGFARPGRAWSAVFEHVSRTSKVQTDEPSPPGPKV
jgi:hypothetical protein